MAVKLTYFNIRGLGEMVRLLLVDQGIEFENITTTHETTWPAIKKAGMEDGTIPFGQMPLYQDEAGSIVQSGAIMRYLARKHGLNGKNDRETVLAEMVAEEAADFRRAYNAVVYGQRCAPEAIAAFVAPLADRSARGSYLAQLEAFVATHGGPFLIGSSLTFADYMLFELIGSIQRLIPDILTAHNTPKLAAWYASFAARPNIKKYVDSDPEHRRAANGNGLA